RVSDEWLKKFKELCIKLNIKKTVKIYESALAKVPMVIGLLKPVILLPVSAFTGLSPKQLESIIVHELAHIIRRDYLVNFLQSILEILFFYHPAVWWINGIIRTERENCCDDIAIEQTGDSVDYAKALASIQEQLLLKKNLALAIAGHKNKLLKRIKRLLNQPKMKTNFIEGFTASCIIFLGILVIALNANAISDKKSGNSENEISFTQNADVKEDSNPVSYDLAVIQDTTIETDEQEKIIMESEEKSTETKKEKKVCSDSDEITEEILRGIEQGLVEMDIDLIVDEAVAGVQAGLSEMNLNAIVKEAVEASQEGIEELDVELVVNEVLFGIKAALEEMDLNAIVGEAMNGVRQALDEIEIESIIEYKDNDDADADDDDDMEDDDDNEIDFDCETFIGNMEHLKVLKKGVNYWNTWRAENKNEKIDLRGACLKEAKLPNINLSNASLEKINFGEAMLNGADFTEANLEEANLKEATVAQAVFNGANMKGINLKEVTLYNIDLRDAVLMYANIKETSMHSVDFRGADLRNANIKEASLQEVDFRKSDLRGADLHEATIVDCKFEGAIADNTTLFPPGFDTKDKGLEFK
ncbi:MAG: pentapeptide repeat-containing protein, partial [Bacteroidales bacterium]